jgi:outer membrane protein assembly factor BamB
VTSAGWIRAWTRSPGGFDLVDGPYPLGPVDLSDKGGIGDKPPAGTGMVCSVRGTNCGRNYEGLCLADNHARGPCIGFAASKADGHLYCIVEDNGKLAVKYAPRIAITRPGAIGDCAFADDGTLWVGSNLFDMSQVYRVDGWEAPETAKVIKIASLGIGFPETLAVRGDVIYRMSDTGVTPSLMTKHRCKR